MIKNLQKHPNQIRQNHTLLDLGDLNNVKRCLIPLTLFCHFAFSSYWLSCGNIKTVQSAP